ncbi:MAG: TM0996/MTH895 family glutaredoxin-like protein [Chloroflexi bacterium]|nr:TM0996/MTH895 family glutaredoxin-like protein [Chloroflexota bacterium]
MHIIILGPGCPNCKKVEALTKEAVAELNLEDVTFQKVTDMAEIMQYPILRTPGLVINGKVVCSGRIPTKAEIKNWLTVALSE